MEEKHLISVVIPTHNRCDLISRAVNSARNQTYKNIEIIVVSDGSEDATDDVMEKIMKEDSRVRYHSYHPNRGGNVARNTGIKMAVEDYVAFLDDDDEWHSDKLEKQMKIIQENPEIGLVCTGTNSVTEGQKTVTVFIPPAKYDSSEFSLVRNCIGSTTTVMVKRELLLKVGLFDEQLGALQDYDLWVRLCRITKVGVVREACVEYNNSQSSNQISSYTDKYEKAVAYLDEKYKDWISELSKEDRDKRNIWFLLLLSKKAKRNGNPKLARQYAVKAGKVKPTKAVIACYGSTFFSGEFVNKVVALTRKVSAKR